MARNRLLTLVVVASLAAPAPAPAEERLAYHAEVDVPVTVATGVFYLALTYGFRPDAVPEVPPSSPPTGLDALGVLTLNPSVAKASDWVLAGVVGGAVVWDTLDGFHDGTPVSRLLLFLEAAALNAAVTDAAKYAVRRPRPYTFNELTGPDDVASFFSGHTSFTAMASFTLARSLDLTGELHTLERVLLYGGATLLTGTVATLRVLAGKHWPTDTLAGAAVGATIGWLVPELHRMPQVSVTPVTMPGGGGGVLVTAAW